MAKKKTATTTRRRTAATRTRTAATRKRTAATRKRTASGRKHAATPGSGRVSVTHVPKPWGHETIWALSDLYMGKILHINAGHELSVQYHDEKDETIYVLSGQIVYRVQRDASDTLDDVQLKVGESFRNTPGTIHQMVALTDCEVLEVSTPHMDDVVRLSDKYGREGTTAP